MSVYVFIVAATLILGAIMPQQGPKRKYYIAVMAVLHAFILGFRYQYLTGDLMKYQSTYVRLVQYDWFSEEVLRGGRNAGFYLLQKLCATIFDYDFQPFLIVTAIIGAVCVAVVIYRYSPAPWMSYLVWNCLSFYIFGFSAVKQALAMNFILLAFIGIAERKLSFYLVMMTIAGLIHNPALIFLPAYWIAKQRVSFKTIVLYAVIGVLLYAFKNQIVDLATELYYDDQDTLVLNSGEIGNRFIMILLFAVFGVLFKGFRGRTFESLFHIMAVAALLQMFAGFNNVFTRLADYYFQLSILYIPMIFFPQRDVQRPGRMKPVFPFNQRSMWLMAVIISLFLIWFYKTYVIGIEIGYDVDNYLNYRFMWDVK